MSCLKVAVAGCAIIAAPLVIIPVCTAGGVQLGAALSWRLYKLAARDFKDMAARSR